MVIHCSLDGLENFFKKESINCYKESDSVEFPTDYLVIDTAVDEKGRPQLIQLYVLNRDIPGKVSQANDREANFIQIKYIYPFEFQAEAVNEIARYVLLINKTLDFLGFCMSEVDSKIFFRCDLSCKKTLIDTELLKGMLGYILLAVDSFCPTMEKLATQEITFQTVLDSFK